MAVRYTDASGQVCQQHFDLKRDADDFDARCRAGIAPEVKLDHGEKRVTFADYADR